MQTSISPKDFWERKILAWENSRYSKMYRYYPPSWPLRQRLRRAGEVLQRRLRPGAVVLELGCGTGRLAADLPEACARYVGLDIAENAILEARRRLHRPGFEFFVADVATDLPPEADVTVFLGLTDWLNPDQLQKLLKDLRSPEILFSYTEAARLNPYRLYRKFADRDLSRQRGARTYSTAEIRACLEAAGYALELIQPPGLFNPGALAWGRRQT